MSERERKGGSGGGGVEGGDLCVSSFFSLFDQRFASARVCICVIAQ